MTAAYEPLKTTRLEIVDEGGHVRAVVGDLAPDSSVVGLALFDDDGRERMSLSLAPEGPSISLAVGGNVVLQIGVYDAVPTAFEPGPYIVLTDRDGATALKCHVAPDGSVEFVAPGLDG